MRGLKANARLRTDGVSTGRGCFEQGNRGNRRTFLGMTLATLAAAPGASFAAPRRRRSKLEEEALRAIPFKKLNESTTTRLREVVLDPSLFRRMPAQVTDCHPDLYLCMVRNPEIVVNIWKVMGITNVRIKRTGPYTFDASDGAGTVSKVELIYGTPDIHVLYAHGAYEGPLFKKRIEGKCVMVLHTDYSKSTPDRHYVSNHMDVFLRVENTGVELIAKTLHPLVGRTADHNFAETTAFLSQISFAAETNNEGLQKFIPKLTGVDPTIRTKFSEIAAKVGREAGAVVQRPRNGVRSSSRPVFGSEGRSNARPSTARPSVRR